MNTITSSKIIIVISIFLIAFGNMSFFTNVLDVYPLTLKNSLFLLSLVMLFVCANIIILSLVCYKYTIKFVLILLLLLSSLSAYFMDAYNVIIDDSMIENIFETNINESLELVSVKQFLYFILLGIVPSIFVFRTNIVYFSLKKSMFSKLKLIGFSCAFVLAIIFIFSDFYASFIEEHKPLRHYSNPTYYIYSTGKYLSGYYKSDSLKLKRVGLDATIPLSEHKRELVIFILGETAREDHFSINGYRKKTNPYLEKDAVISFNNVWSCGTSTAYSVPCLFSIDKQSSFNKNDAKSTENLLDVLQRAGVNVLWLDNNSSSKGVADRIPYESYKLPDKNPRCDIECRDEGMLVDLQKYIDAHPQGDIFIVLHQMGNHGPAYYKRYPKKFEKFKPVCKTNQLEQCSTVEINNAYDNAILYSDYFFHKTIALLKNNTVKFDSAMFYVSDHGESLGESGLYLHGLPYFIAPDSQKHVPLIMWFSQGFGEKINLDALKTKISTHFSHDNISSTILGLMEVVTDVYDKKMDMIEHIFKPGE